MDTTTKGIGKEKKQKYEQEHKQTAPASAYSKFVQTVQEILKLFQCDCGAEYTSNNHHYQNHIKNFAHDVGFVWQQKCRIRESESRYPSNRL